MGGTGDPAAGSAGLQRRSSLNSLLPVASTTTTTEERQKSLTSSPSLASELISTVSTLAGCRQSAPNPRTICGGGASQREELSAWLDKIMLRHPAGDGGDQNVGRRRNKGKIGDEGGQGWQVAHSGLDVVRVLRRVGFASETKGGGGEEGFDGSCCDGSNRGCGSSAVNFSNGAGDGAGSGVAEYRRGIGRDRLRLHKVEGVTV